MYNFPYFPFLISKDGFQFILHEMKMKSNAKANAYTKIHFDSIGLIKGKLGFCRHNDYCNEIILANL